MAFSDFPDNFPTNSGTSKKKAEFHKVIRVGQTKATIYKTPTNGCDSYTVVWYKGPVRKRKAFSDAGLAEIHASAQVNNLSQGETWAATLSGEECLEYVRARNTIQGYARVKRRVTPGALIKRAKPLVWFCVVVVLIADWLIE